MVTAPAESPWPATIMSVGLRNSRIDMLRGVSSLLVLVRRFNIAYLLNDTVLAAWSGWLVVRTVARNGNYGVTIFFVISGFLITSNAIRRWGPVKRLRIIPVLCAAGRVHRSVRAPALVHGGRTVISGCGDVPESRIRRAVADWTMMCRCLLSIVPDAARSGFLPRCSYVAPGPQRCNPAKRPEVELNPRPV